MSKYVIDLTNFKERTSARLPEGRYRVVVEDVEVQQTKTTQKDMINVFMAVHAPGTEEHGRVIIDRLVQSEGALFRTVSFLQALGVKTAKKRLAMNLDQWVGKHLMIEVEDGEPYNGRVSSEVRAHMPLPKKDAGAAEEADLDDAPDDLDNDSSDEEKPAAAEPEKAKDEDDDSDLDLDEIDL